MQTKFEAFKTMDLGSTKPTSIATEIVEVEISTDNLFADYGKAFVNEGYRVNPLKAEQINLTEEEMTRYCEYLLMQRVKTVELNCPDFRKLKALYIPVWIQYVLSMIGEVNLRDRGLKLVPKTNDSDLTFKEALDISEKIGSFADDLQIVRDAMPRSIEGDKDVMSTALIDGYVRSLDKSTHVASTYVTAFLGMKLKEESAFKVLYRVQYDDADFIRSALTRQKGLY